MKSSINGVLAAALLLAGCGGGGGTFSGGGPPPAVTPSPVPQPQRNASERATIQAVLIGLQYTTLQVGGTNATALSARRVPSSARTTRDVGCTNGFAEKDSAPGQNVFRRVVSLYYDPQCAVVREVGTLDSSLGIDTSDLNGSAISYDRNGAVTAYQTVAGFFFASGGGFATLQTTDARTVGGTPFARAGQYCDPNGCTAGATINGASFATGVTLSSGKPTGSPPNSVTLQAVTYAGPAGSLTLTNPQPNMPPAITGGQPVGGLSGAFTMSLAGYGPTAVSIDAAGSDGSRFSASLANGVTTITASGSYAATITVDANGNGHVSYPDGSSETVVDYRDVG